MNEILMIVILFCGHAQIGVVYDEETGHYLQSKNPAFLDKTLKSMNPEGKKVKILKVNATPNMKGCA